jgi:tetratricopeptide (TPR) repeat protein
VRPNGWIAARRLFEQAIALRRDNAQAINNLAVLYANLGQTKDAIAAFRYGIRVAPDEDLLYLNLSRTWLRLGERDKARDVMRELLARKPGHALAQKALQELGEP